MTRTPDIRVLHNAADTVGESPLWDAQVGCVWWVDTLGHRINRLDWTTGAACTSDVALPPGELASQPDAGALLAFEPPADGWSLPRAHLQDAEPTTTRH